MLKLEAVISYYGVLGALRELLKRPVFFIAVGLIRLWGVYKRGVWLVGENRGVVVGDNGYYYYLYCRRNHPEKKVYFCASRRSIAKDSALKGDNNVVEFGTLRHAYIFCKTSLCFYTHEVRDVAYESTFIFHGRNKLLIYLHHGVLGFKTFDASYKKGVERVRLFFVGFDHEKDILLKNTALSPDQICVTGYPRYDYLLNHGDSNNGLSVIYSPTFRECKNKEEIFMHHRMRLAFLENKGLLRFIEEKNITIYVNLHVLEKRYSYLYEGVHINVVVVSGGDSFFKALLQSQLMVTDYSSVAWDFMYLGKQVIYYRYDLYAYQECRGGYVSLTSSEYGDVFQEGIGIVDYIISFFSADDFGFSKSIYDGGGCCDEIYKISSSISS